MIVTVYTKPGCGPCRATQRALTAAGIDFRAVDLTANADALAHVRQLGYSSAPVVEASATHWAGFQPDKIIALKS
ncbi:glutaredoxin-like protein NrdH [Naumannella cuiyingiana]|uniref:Glutaredoxin-like protein NrdH n=1 Tax=Naumannella cuiyingiana TaxID=1347891 RepID=A0A7Z0DCB7_9ACTN|nr:glutaredoxin family protein [Naumannella cuiyingiana]NYI72714.1 glutaredoxin-like protein NrdH [Naumannella cuiyingiana]